MELGCISYSPAEHWLLSVEQGEDPPKKFAALDPMGKAIVLAHLHRRYRRPIFAIFPSRGEARSALDNVGFIAGPNVAIRFLPSIDGDYHRNVLPSPEDHWERNCVLFHLLNDVEPAITITTVAAVLQKALKPERFLNATLSLQANQSVPREALLAGLSQLGYRSMPTASDPGSYAVRGGVLDVFSPLYKHPFRIEYVGDSIETLRFFDPDNQRSLEPISGAHVIPVRAGVLPQSEDFPLVSSALKARLDNIGYPKGDREELLLKVREGALGSSLDHLFPVLSGGSEPVTEYIPQNAIIVSDGQVMEVASEMDYPRLEKNHSLYEQQPSPIAQREDLIWSPLEFKTWLEQRPEVKFAEFAECEKSDTSYTLKTDPIHIPQVTSAEGKLPFENLAKRFTDWMELGYRIHFVFHTRLQAERARALLQSYQIRCDLYAEAASLSALLSADFQRIHIWQGFITANASYPTLRVIILSEEAVFGRRKRVSGGRSTRSAAKNILTLRELKAGDFVVHKDHGIGRYLGLQSRDFIGIPNDYALIEYRDGDKLYVPVYRLNVVQKFSSGESQAPALDKLGGERWAKVKSKAQRAVAELAAQFLETHAKRKTIPSRPCPPPDADFERFEMEFPYDETPDQLKAVEDVFFDLEKTYPMNRLLCGDVGYGKTEVAMRAAYRVAMQGRQVAVLVPTTMLALQHFETFLRRFRNTPVKIDMVSRLRNAAQVKSTLHSLRDGKADIIIGTHRLLSSDTAFKDLGLVVIDEEHRFGVLHKERLKKLCETVHILSMTATPIPRTLNMAMSGISDTSIITTPPPDRLSVRTFVSRHDEEIIREAISNELARDGQVYYVHNRIETIHGIADELRALFPSLRFQVVHGQVEPKELEHAMLGFFKNDFQVLVTTAIVESGLDNPRANTMLIDRADTFGLAQLYQLRGRVGRADRRAYCYLLVPGETLMTPDAKERLQIMQRYSDLGSGFQIASQDLDVRGAGDLLGQQQSGHINSVGIDLYFELLEEAVRDLQGKPKGIEIEPEINLRIPAYFPADYLPDISERVNIYRRLASLENGEAIHSFELELRDRFGNPPNEVLNLMGLMYLRLELKKLHVTRMSCGPKRTSLQFAPSTPASPERLVRLIQKNPKTYSLTPAGADGQKLVFDASETDWKAILREVELLSSRLGVREAG